MNLIIANAILILCLYIHGVFGVDIERVSVREGDSVTLNTGVQTNQQDDIRWYNNDTQIAQIRGDLSKICTDVQCNEDYERFRDRLKLDHQTGSLTITNTKNEDSGEYKLKIFSNSGDSEKIFSVSVQERVSVMEGDSITLKTGVQTNKQENIKWYINDIQIAEITGDQSQICTEDQCKGRFRDRLKVDHQTGSLTITNTTNTDSGVYTLQIRNSIMKSFSVSVIAPPSGLSSGAVVGIFAAVLVCLVLLGSALFYLKKKYARQNETGTENRTDEVAHEPLNGQETSLVHDSDGTS